MILLFLVFWTLNIKDAYKDILVWEYFLNMITFKMNFKSKKLPY